MIGSALAMKTLEAMGYSELRNPTLHCHRMENRCAHLDIAIEGTHGGHQTSFLISYPWSILWHLSWGPARTWLYAYRSYKCPYNLLGTTSFSMATKIWKTMVYQLAVHSFISFLFCLIQKNCFKHPTFSNDCIFSINFASITKTFYYSKIQYCLNVPPTIMIFVRFNDWFNVIR